MKLAPITTARRDDLARSMSARLSASERNVRTCGGATADDDDALRTALGRARLRRHAPLGGGDLVAHENTAAALLDAPARHRVEGRGRQRLAGAQAEAGVVPRAAHGIADHEPLGERATVMRAGRADGEDLAAAPRQEHRLALPMAHHHPPPPHTARPPPA